MLPLKGYALAAVNSNNLNLITVTYTRGRSLYMIVITSVNQRFYEKEADSRYTVAVSRPNW